MFIYKNIGGLEMLSLAFLLIVRVREGCYPDHVLN